VRRQIGQEDQVSERPAGKKRGRRHRGTKGWMPKWGELKIDKDCEVFLAPLYMLSVLKLASDDVPQTGEFRDIESLLETTGFHSDIIRDRDEEEMRVLVGFWDEIVNQFGRWHADRDPVESTYIHSWPDFSRITDFTIIVSASERFFQISFKDASTGEFEIYLIQTEQRGQMGHEEQLYERPAGKKRERRHGDQGMDAKRGRAQDRQRE
jgi:hypothetical protein